MILCDVNVLVHAYREDSSHHKLCWRYFNQILNDHQAFGWSELIHSGFLRIVTNAKVFNPPSPLEDALVFLDQISGADNGVPLVPGRRHWQIFSDLCRRANAKGNLIPDAYLAALAIETGSTFVTTDRDYAKFPGLSWKYMLEEV